MVELPLRKSSGLEESLSLKQLAFCHEYMIDKNPIFAYIRAGYLGRGKVAEKESSRLLKLTKIQTKLQELKAQESSQVLDLPRRVVKEFEKIAFSRSPNLIENFGEGSNDNNLQAAIREIQVTQTDITLSMHDKSRALQALAQISGLNHDLNFALATLRKYGLHLYQENGTWLLSDEQHHNDIQLIESEVEEENS
ncbi:hypothetical protein F7734_43230 [Scytonema sp. UIC 10036]|uniref:terminase small subunit n=1 Tax=Scytonema sp. UIC 10036 TaxID=2304196 RepID=UPI0012DA18C9|nr:terminase small subunit [Scytonema sp. UIC 10036]MUG98747.1 hypothetical protein [Scytonema sp. UIC 10036]